MLPVVGIKDINIRIKQDQGFSYGIRKGVIHVPNLGHNLFSSYVAAQKHIYTLHMDTGCHLLEQGKVIMIGVVHNRMYRLSIEVIQPELASTALYATSTSFFGVPTISGSKQTLDTWHRRMAHVNHATIQKMASEGLVEGLILKGRNKSLCPRCAYSKQHKAPFLVNEHRERLKAPEDLIHTDLYKLMTVPSVGGALYFVLFKDDCSGFRVIECIKKKPETFGAFRRFVVQLKNETDNSIKILRSNPGIEYTNDSFTKFLDKEMIKQELTTPYTLEHNGLSERKNQTIMESIRSMLHAAKVHVKFWAEIAHTTVYTLNCTALRTTEGRTPYELWYKSKPSVSHLHIFGADMYVHVSNEL